MNFCRISLKTFASAKDLGTYIRNHPDGELKNWKESLEIRSMRNLGLLSSTTHIIPGSLLRLRRSDIVGQAFLKFLRKIENSSEVGFGRPIVAENAMMVVTTGDMNDLASRSSLATRRKKGEQAEVIEDVGVVTQRSSKKPRIDPVASKKRRKKHGDIAQGAQSAEKKAKFVTNLEQGERTRPPTQQSGTMEESCSSDEEEEKAIDSVVLGLRRTPSAAAPSKKVASVAAAHPKHLEEEEEEVEEEGGEEEDDVTAKRSPIASAEQIFPKSKPSLQEVLETDQIILDAFTNLDRQGFHIVNRPIEIDSSVQGQLVHMAHAAILTGGLQQRQHRSFYYVEDFKSLFSISLPEKKLKSKPDWQKGYEETAIDISRLCDIVGEQLGSILKGYIFLPNESKLFVSRTVAQIDNAGPRHEVSDRQTIRELHSDAIKAKAFHFVRADYGGARPQFS